MATTLSCEPFNHIFIISMRLYSYMHFLLVVLHAIGVSAVTSYVHAGAKIFSCSVFLSVFIYVRMLGVTPLQPCFCWLWSISCSHCPTTFACQQRLSLCPSSTVPFLKTVLTKLASCGWRCFCSWQSKQPLVLREGFVVIETKILLPTPVHR